MAVLNDLIAQIENEELRRRIEAEVERMNKQKKFGLVFEEHLPESTPLYDIPVKVDGTVMLRADKNGVIYRVLKIEGEEATCVKKDSTEPVTFSLRDLVTVAEFGEPIYPYLKPLDSVCNAPDSDLWHTLIEADNYHALQLLEYLYAGKVDCIYIDPPYNTGAKDWKYNNDYVDSADSYRHSKWLSMMQKRLQLAKKLLNPRDSVLIITIDEKEYLHLGCLLEDMFPEARMEMVSSVINPSGAGGRNEFSRVDEYIFFLMFGDVKICRSKDDMLYDSSEKTSSRIKGGLSWESFLRSGQSNVWTKENALCYPILINEETMQVVKCLPPLKGPNPEMPKYIEGYRALYPIKNNGQLGIWRLVADSFEELLKEGYAYISTYDQKNDRYAIKYLLSGTVERINKGEITVKRPDPFGPVVSDDGYSALTMPKTVWNKSSHNAGKSGSDILNKMYAGQRRFSYPKSLYAVQDTIRFFVGNKPNALIVDFFAGSGTTLHAVNLLNAEDNGSRRCIMVTNNEMSGEEAKVLASKGFCPGDEEWDALGIARYVTWPRTVCSITGLDVLGKAIKGNYLESDRPMAQGFPTNAVFFKLGFLDKNAVALGRQFKELIPVLWMKAGAIGECPTLHEEQPKMLVLPKNRFAVLTDERYFMEFVEELDKHPEIETVYVVTDSDRAYRDMIAFMDGKKTYQLYRDYLDNFRINSVRR